MTYDTTTQLVNDYLRHQKAAIARQAREDAEPAPIYDPPKPRRPLTRFECPYGCKRSDTCPHWDCED